MKYSTIISKHSLDACEIGNPIGEPNVTQYASGKKALLALHAAINSKSGANRFLIGTPDKREIPFDQAYFEIFKVQPVQRDGRENSYPRLK